MPNIEVLEKIDSLQKAIPKELYVRYNPANNIIKPSSHISLLFLTCMSDENNAVPKNIIEAIVNKSPISLCVFPLSNMPFSKLIPSHNAIFDSISSIAFSLPKL